MDLPSELKHGVTSLEASMVNLRGCPPPAGIRKISALPSGRESNTRYCPSGDQWGLPVTGPPKLVRRTGERPSASAVQISSFPVRLLRNAILWPSGEYCGLESRRLLATR